MLRSHASLPLRCTDVRLLTGDQITPLFGHEAEFSGMILEVPEGISVAIPENAKGREIHKGKTIIPSPDVHINNVIFFKDDENQGKMDRIVIRYEVPPTASQIIFAEYLAKILLVLLVPICTLLYLPSKDIGRPKTRRWIIFVGISLQAIVVSGIIGYAFLYSTKITIESWIELFVGLLMIAFQIGIIFVKSKPETKDDQEP